VDATGDTAVLDEQVRFLSGPDLEPGQDETLMTPEDSGTRASVFDHCCRAIDRSLTRGAHGLPLMGSGDWNDGMNRVGREGRGESVWLGFFLVTVLQRFIPLCAARGDHERAARYRESGDTLTAALNDAGWDGQWYRRAYYDDGTPLGSKEGTEARIDAIAQAWAVLSGVATVERARSALDAAEAHLVDESSGLIRLLTPPFDRTPHDPGYIKGYLPGVRENGGQYTHGALWVVRALAEAGRGERAALLLEMLTPIRHTDSPEAVRNYQVEPYVVAADVYAVAPHVGRGGWTWYTGSAGWMYRIALETILGVTLRAGREIVLRPCIPASWREVTIRYRLPDLHTTYEILVRRTNGETTSVTGAQARVEDGALIFPIVPDGSIHRVDIELGADVGPRYRSFALEPAQ
jgi:cyclic beta-1,2-glucan synthetase